jgi:hypothetical protein
VLAMTLFRKNFATLMLNSLASVLCEICVICGLSLISVFAG